MMYMGNVIMWLLCNGIMYIEKKGSNAKVRNHNLRGLENEMTEKVVNFIEINKRSGWQLAPLR